MSFRRRAITLVELLTLILFFTFLMFCTYQGWKTGARYGGVWGAVGLAVGVATWMTAIAVLGGLLFVAITIERLCGPAHGICICAEAPVLPHLVANAPPEIKALEDSERVEQIAELGSTNVVISLGDMLLRDEDGISDERLQLVQQLLSGDLARGAKVLVGHVPHLRKVRYPRAITSALRSAVPPRLIALWALACTDRARAAFQREYHQDSRPLQLFGVAVELWRNDPELETWLADDGKRVRLFMHCDKRSGCQVFSRSFRERLWGWSTKGKCARWALCKCATFMLELRQPSGLWRCYDQSDIANCYETAENRVERSHPAILAQEIAANAAYSSEDVAGEIVWQRDELARLILGWPTWDEDRAAHAHRLEEEWIPRVCEVSARLPFDTAKYIEHLRRELAPWGRA